MPLSLNPVHSSLPGLLQHSRGQRAKLIGILCPSPRAQTEAPPFTATGPAPAKPDLTGQLPECPLTRAVKPADPIATLQRDAKAAVEAAGGFPLEVHATPELDALGVGQRASSLCTSIHTCIHVVGCFSTRSQVNTHFMKCIAISFCT